MLREYGKTHQLSLRRFWLRRCLRILPVYYTHLLVLAILQATTGYAMDPKQWLRAITFTYNYGESQWLPGHIWSLCVEEQFYFVWPMLFVLIGPRKNAMCILAAIVILSAAAFRTLPAFGYEHSAFSWGSLLTNYDALAVGCLLGGGVFAYDGRSLFDNHRRNSLAVVIGFLAVIVPYVFWKMQVGGWWNVPLGPIFQSSGFGILMVLSVRYHNHWATQWLQTRVMSTLGVFSYSIYIWQQIFCSNRETLGDAFLQLRTFPVWLVAAFTCAVASYYLVESPFLKLKDRFK